MVVFNVIRAHIVYVTIKVGVAKHSWTSWPRLLPLCPYETFSKVGDYAPLPNAKPKKRVSVRVHGQPLDFSRKGLRVIPVEL